ncbi:MAG: hypothetical protein IPK82_42960 [Polyangiaceae bacterium]|nr:hypothetical protein [Polyangiaceae bacterium]
MYTEPTLALVSPENEGERRRRRSEDPITALHYQLAATRWEAALDALVLVDDAGCLIAGVGSWPICEELAAFAPLLADPGSIRHAGLGSRLAALCTDVELLQVFVDGAPALLCARGGNDKRGASIARAAAGCSRILS